VTCLCGNLIGKINKKNNIFMATSMGFNKITYLEQETIIRIYPRGDQFSLQTSESHNDDNFNISK
jgi:hypothetical protein